MVRVSESMARQWTKWLGMLIAQLSIRTTDDEVFLDLSDLSVDV